MLCCCQHQSRDCLLIVLRMFLITHFISSSALLYIALFIDCGHIIDLEIFYSYSFCSEDMQKCRASSKNGETNVTVKAVYGSVLPLSLVVFFENVFFQSHSRSTLQPTLSSYLAPNLGVIWSNLLVIIWSHKKKHFVELLGKFRPSFFYQSENGRACLL